MEAGPIKESELGNRPRALHLYSGPQRANDLAHQLSTLGWAVCSVDLEQPHPIDLRDRMIHAGAHRQRRLEPQV